MSLIESVSCRLVRVPLARETSFATRRVEAREYLLVRVRSADGVEGLGLTYAGNLGGLVALEAARTLLSPLLIGEDGFRVEGLWQKMYQQALLQGRAGAVMRALSALDIALWDRNARAAGLPLWRYLGGHADGRVPAYASGGYYAADKTAADLAREMQSYAALGFDAMKMKVGLLDPAAEEARVAAVRKAIGDDVELFLDANNAWPDLMTALRYIRRFEDYRPGWIEEPFSPDDIESHARLTGATSIPVATGEVEAGRWRFQVILERRAAHVLQTDALVCGGVTEWRRIAAVASAYGVPVCPHAWHQVHIHLAAAVPNCPYVEYFVDEEIVGLQRLFDRRLEAKDGAVMLPDAPGLGFGFDEATVEQLSLSAWQEVH